MTHIKTFTGKRWYITDPQPHLVCLEDIAHALAHQCRFNGHIRWFYSVAQHAVLVADEVFRLTSDVELALWGLHHDDEEAYTGDMVKPLKSIPEMHAFRDVAARTQAAIVEALGLVGPEPAVVKLVDKQMLATEQRDLLVRWEDGEPESFEGALEHLHLAQHAQDDGHSFGGRHAVACWEPQRAAVEFTESHLKYVAMRAAMADRRVYLPSKS